MSLDSGTRTAALMIFFVAGMIFILGGLPSWITGTMRLVLMGIWLIVLFAAIRFSS